MKPLFLVAILAITFSSCLKNDSNSSSQTCTYNPCGLVAPTGEINAVQSYLTANSITATQHCSGLFYAIDNPGTGASATACSNISFTYEGRLTNGNVFDQATSPVSYNLSQLIAGFKNGIPLIKAGGSIRLYVPPSLGYGASQAGSIPPNSILIFKATLTAVQ